MAQSLPSAARQLAAGTVAWLFILVSPASAQLTPAIGAFASPDAELGVVRTIAEYPDDQFSYFTPGDTGISIGVGVDGTARSGLADSDQRSPFARPSIVGARLDRDVGPVDLTLSGRVGAIPRTAVEIDGRKMWSTGMEIGVRGLSVAGFYTRRNGDDADSVYSYDAALRYRTGPWGFALAYSSGGALGEAGGVESERLEQYSLALNYRLASNVEFAAFGGYVAGELVNDPRADRIDDDISGFVFGTGLSLDF